MAISGMGSRSEPIKGVEPSVLAWARQSLGLSLDDVALKLKKPVATIASWETGDDSPSYAQLEKLAYDVYHRPLATFFLPAPPDEVPPQREFRTLPATDLASLAVDTHLHLRKGHAFQLALRELYGELNSNRHPIWRNLKLRLSEPIKTQASAIRSSLGVSLDEQQGWDSDDTALKKWRTAIEQVGVFVFKSSFKQRDISGFCLTDPEFPIIYLNNSVAATRQTFSLMHELAHLLLNVNGLSKYGESYVDFLPASEKAIEKFCNAIAAEVLMPSDDFEYAVSRIPFRESVLNDSYFASVARRYGVSREAVARRLLDAGRISQTFYASRSAAWSKQKARSSGGNYYNTQSQYLSYQFAREVIGRYFNQQLSTNQAADLLGMKAKNLAGFEQKILQVTSA